MATDTLEVFGQEWTGVTGFKATDDNDQIKTFIRPQGTINISQNGQGIDVSQYASANVAVPNTTFLLAYEFSSDKTAVTFTPSYADTKTAVQANNQFYYMCVFDDACGEILGVNTNYSFHGTTFTECVRFALEDTNDGGMYQVAWGYVSGSLTTRTYKIYSNDFVVTVSWNSSTNRYEPNKTFSEIQTAYNAGKTIAVVSSEESVDSAVDGEYHTGANPYFEYWVRKYMDGYSPQTIRESGYQLKSTGYTTVDNLDYIRPSGTINISQSGNTDVTNYATASVAAGSATAPASISGTSATVSTGTNTLTLSKTVSVTPSVSAGYVSSGTAGNSSVSLQASVTTKAAATIRASTSQQTIASGTYLTGTQTIAPVSQTNLSAENIKSGTTISISNGSSNIWSVTGTYTGGSSKNIQAYWGRAQRTANSYGATDLTITVSKSGTYNVYWTAWRGSSSGTMGTNLYKNGTAGTNQQTFTGTYGQNITLTNQSYNQGDVLTLYATSGSTTRSIYVANLVIVEQ